MASFFASVVVAVKNIKFDGLESVHSLLSPLQDFDGEYELIVVDNGSTDGSAELLGAALESGEIDNTIVLRLADEVEIDSALWVGVDSALGDFVVTIPASEDSAVVLPELLALGRKRIDVGIAINEHPIGGSLAYRLTRKIISRALPGGPASLSRCFVLSRRLISFLQRHSQPQTTFRQLTRVPGLKSELIRYRSEPIQPGQKTLAGRYAAGMQYLLWRNPKFLRGASLLALFGAAVNVVYALYVLGVFLFGSNVEPGWVSSSLQFSGMFFLFSLTLFILGENVLLTISIAGRDPVAFVSEERVSKKMGRLNSINIRESQGADTQHETTSSTE